jgi:DNA-binding NarL/FixJ family response regulator
MRVCSHLLQHWPSTKPRNGSWSRAGSTPQKLARQCEVILLASQGIPNQAIAQRTGLSRPTVIATRKGFVRGASPPFTNDKSESGGGRY